MGRARVVARTLTALLAPLAIGAATSRCYSATEVRIEISTDLACGPMTTRLSVGTPRDANGKPVTTNACTGGPPNSDIGSIHIVPSGSRDAPVGVKVVLARGAKDPAACESDPTDCIQATRSLRFIPHTSRVLPIRLSGSCLGVVCPRPGDTCIDGTCVSDDVCDDCVAPPAPGIDGGADASADAPDEAASDTDAGSNDCRGPLGDGVLTRLPGAPRRLIAHGTRLHWLHDRKLFRLPKAPNPGTTFTSEELTPAADPNLLAVYGGGIWFVHAPGAAYLTPKDDGLPPGPGVGVSSAPVDIVLAGQKIYAASALEISSATKGLAAADVFRSFGANQITAGVHHLFALSFVSGTVAGPLHGCPYAGMNCHDDIGKTSAWKRIASDGITTVGALGPDASFPALSQQRVVRILESAPPAEPQMQIVALSSGVVSAIATDSQSVFWVEQESVEFTHRIQRAPLAAGTTAGKTIVSGYGSISELVVDGQCVYFWGIQTASDPGALRVAPKTP